MCVFNLVLFVLFCGQALSGTPEIGHFWPTPPEVEPTPRTWLSADLEIATRSDEGSIETGTRPSVEEWREKIKKPITMEEAKKKTWAEKAFGRWNKAWWYATSRSPDNEAQWQAARKLLRTEFKKATWGKRDEYVIPHAFVGIKLKIDSFAYDEAKKAYEETHAGETYPPPGTLPEGWTLLWANGQAHEKEIELDAEKTPFQTRILLKAVNRADTQDAVQRVIQKGTHYDKGIEIIKGKFDALEKKREREIEKRKREDCDKLEIQAEKERCEKELDDAFDKWRASALEKKKPFLYQNPMAQPILGLVMFYEQVPRTKGPGLKWIISNKFVSIDESIDESFFFVQELEKGPAEEKGSLTAGSSSLLKGKGKKLTSSLSMHGSTRPKAPILVSQSETELAAAGSSRSSHGKKKEISRDIKRKEMQSLLTRKRKKAPILLSQSGTQLAGTGAISPERTRRDTVAYGGPDVSVPPPGTFHFEPGATWHAGRGRTGTAADIATRERPKISKSSESKSSASSSATARKAMKGVRKEKRVYRPRSGTEEEVGTSSESKRHSAHNDEYGTNYRDNYYNYVGDDRDGNYNKVTVCIAIFAMIGICCACCTMVLGTGYCIGRVHGNVIMKRENMEQEDVILRGGNCI